MFYIKEMVRYFNKACSFSYFLTFKHVISHINTKTCIFDVCVMCWIMDRWYGMAQTEVQKAGCKILCPESKLNDTGDTKMAQII